MISGVIRIRQILLADKEVSRIYPDKCFLLVEDRAGLFCLGQSASLRRFCAPVRYDTVAEAVLYKMACDFRNVRPVCIHRKNVGTLRRISFKGDLLPIR